MLIGNFTRMMWVAFHRNQSKDIEKFKIFKSRVENESSLKIKYLRLDLEVKSLFQISLTNFVRKMV